MPICLPSFAGVAQPASGGTPFTNQYSVDFDGTDDYMDAGNITAINSVANASFSFWYKTSATGKVGLIGGGVRTSAYHWIDGNMYIHSFVNTLSHPITIPTLGAWHHIVCTFEASGSKAYLDGNLVSTVDHGDITASNAGTGFQVGRVPHYGIPDGQKLIDEVALFTSTLSASDVTAIYNSGVPADLTSYSPVSWWRMGDNDGGTGTTITDQGSGSNDGTLTNGPTFSTDVPHSNTYSVDFDGTNDYIDCGTITGLQGSSNGAISVWIKPDTAGDAPNIGYRPSPDHQFVLTFVGGTLYFGVRNGSTANIYTTTAMPNDTNWHNYVATFNSGTTKIYIDGSEVSGTQTGTNPSTISSTSGSFFIGRNGEDNKYTDGLLDEAALFNTAISASDVTAIYNSGVPADISSLSPLGWWRMGDNDLGTGTTITDQGSGGNNGTLTNGPTFSTTVPS